MAEYSEVTRESVLRAMQEYDALGEDGFFEKYEEHGYGRATRYVVVHDGKEYDSKAILLAAHSHQNPDRKPLDHDAFSGGLATVVPHLQDLDFAVRDLETGELLTPGSRTSSEHRSSPQVILQPASTSEPQANYRKTIENSVSIERIRPHVSDRVLERLRRIYPDDQAQVWAATDGTRNRNYVESMRPGDIVLFYKSGRFYAAMDVTLTDMRNESLGRELWGDKTPGETWPHIFFLTEPRPIDIQYRELQEVADFGPADTLRGLTILPVEAGRRVLNAFDLEDPEAVDPQQERAVEAAEEAQEAEEAKRKGQGYASSAELRKAIEMHAMARCTEHFESRGYRVEDVSARKSYDLCCTRGGEVLCVEVKGTQSLGQTVNLTANEVELAKSNKAESVLFVLHSVEVNYDQGIRAAAGSVRIYWPWFIEDGVLTPTTYRYETPLT